MSPEQLQGKPADSRSDLFSFGCILYETLTGTRAFEGSSAASVIAAILEREPAPFITAPPLERILKRCLAKDPDQRFQTARDLRVGPELGAGGVTRSARELLKSKQRRAAMGSSGSACHRTRRHCIPPFP